MAVSRRRNWRSWKLCSSICRIISFHRSYFYSRVSTATDVLVLLLLLLPLYDDNNKKERKNMYMYVCMCINTTREHILHYLVYIYTKKSTLTPSSSPLPSLLFLCHRFVPIWLCWTANKVYYATHRQDSGSSSSTSSTLSSHFSWVVYIYEYEEKEKMEKTRAWTLLQIAIFLILSIMCRCILLSLSLIHTHYRSKYFLHLAFELLKQLFSPFSHPTNRLMKCSKAVSNRQQEGKSVSECSYNKTIFMLYRNDWKS